MTLLDRLADPQLYGRLAVFRDLSTWSAWLVFVKAVHGLPLASDAERDLFLKHTGRQVYAPPPGGHPVSVAIVGRQSGKSGSRPSWRPTRRPWPSPTRMARTSTP